LDKKVPKQKKFYIGVLMDTETLELLDKHSKEYALQVGLHVSRSGFIRYLIKKSLG